MSLLTFSEIYKSFGNQDVLQGVSFFISPRRKAGLIGANGAGKSTILHLITGREQPDSGKVALQPNARVALLSQEPLLGDARTVLEAAQRPTEELQQVWQELTALEAAALEDERALERHDTVHHRYQDLGGYECENRAKEVLAGLGFLEESWRKPVSVLSGGERTRLALVQILVLQPELLLLDEPTNHVDWEACEWLQEYLRRYPGAALIVSHDRYFLDAVVEEIIELERGRSRTYQGNYSAYSQKKAVEREQAEEIFRRQQEEIQRQQEIIQRLRSHRKFASMHSRERTLEKLQDEQLEKPRADRRGLKVNIQKGVQSGREVLAARDLEQGFGDRTLFTGVSFSLERGERLALVGPNGAGKTTMLRTLAGELAPRAGGVTYGHRVRPAYFAQDLSSLDPEASVWETIWETGALDNQQTMQALHQFLFAGDILNREVGELSGGERTRLALCRLLVSRPNLLLLDEPTNHLDILSREAVERALRAYAGGVVVVSHDRYFLAAVATRMLEVRGGAHRLFAGGFQAYRAGLRPAAPPPRRSPAAAKSSGPPTGARPRPVSPSRRLGKVEEEIARQEQRHREIAALLADGATWTDATGAADLSAEYEVLNSSLAGLYAEWEALAEAAGAG